MTTERFQIHEGMEVLGADQKRVGQVAAVRASDFMIERPSQHAIAVPFGAIGDVTGNEVVLTITADHVDTIKWPHRDETEDQPAGAEQGPGDTIIL